MVVGVRINNDLFDRISSDCLDEEGNFRENGSEWMSPSNPCVTFTCVNGEVNKAEILCDFVSPPSPNCFLPTEQDQCCPEWNCR